MKTTALRLAAMMMISSAAVLAGNAPSANAAAARIEAAIAKDERPDALQTISLVADGAVLIDVRSQGEWSAGHAKGALLMPWRNIEQEAPAKLPNKDTPIVTYCAVGVRAWYGATSLRKLGYTHVTAMTGGFDDLKKAGYPTE